MIDFTQSAVCMESGRKNTVNDIETLLKNLDMLSAAPEESAVAAEMIKVLCELSHEFSRSDPDRGEKFASRALVLSEKYQLKQEIVHSMLALGTLDWAKGNFRNALEHYNEALDLCNEIEYRKGTASCLCNIGIIERIQGNHEESLKSHIKSLKIKEELSDFTGIARSYNNIAIMYDERGQYDDALDYYLKALQIFVEHEDRLGIALCYNNIGVVYQSTKEYSQALECFDRSSKIKKELDDKKGIADTLLNIGTLYEEKKDYKNAIINCHKALGMYNDLGDKRGIADANNRIGHMCIQLERYDQGLTFLNKGLELAIDIGAKGPIAESYQYLSLLYQAQGNFEQALICYKQFNDHREQIFDSTNSEKMARMQVAYETTRNEKEAENYRTFFNNSIVGMYRISGDGNILLANSTLAIMLGYFSPDDLKQHNIHETRSDSEHPLLVFKDHFENENATHGQKLIWFKRDGSILQVWENYRAVRDESDDIKYFEGTVEEITEREK